MTEDPAANPDDPGAPDYDSPWKEAIDAWLPPFMALFFPTVHTLIDWDRPYEFLDAELQRITGDSTIGRRYADRLVKVYSREGLEVWLLLHIEIQGQAEAGFPSAAKRGFWKLHFGGKGDKQPELPDDDGWGRGRRPVINVSWNDAVAYCVWLTGQTGRTYRLPSEAEWEYGGRAGTTTRWSCGDDARALGDYAWFGNNSGGRTHPVGEKRPNPWGLHDIHGNVLEWVQGVWHDDYAGAPTNGSAWGASNDTAGRVWRGGSWYSGARGTRVSFRYWNDPDYRYDDLGLRLAQDL